MSVATPPEVRQVGIALESVRGTAATAPTKYLSLTKDSNVDYVQKLLEDPALRGYSSKFASFAGAQDGKGPFKSPVRASDMPWYLKMLLAAPSATAEQASFVVQTGVNDTLDFLAGVTDYHVTLAAGTYAAGQSQADTGTLCKLIYDGMHAQEGSGTYTVTYSRSTGLFTITKSTGTFSLKFATGTNTAKTVAPLIGFAVADQTGADSYTGTVVQAPPFKYTFVQGNNVQLPSYTIFVNRGMQSNPTKVYNLGALSKLKISGKDDAPVEYEAELMAQQEAVYGGAWSYALSESPALMFSQTVVKFAGNAPTVPNVAEWSIEMDPAVVAYRPLSSQKYPYDFLAKGPFLAQGDMKVYFMDETERAKFIAATTTSLEFLIQGTVVAGGTVQNTLDLSFPVVEYESFPFQDENGFLGATVKWRARGSIAAGVYVPVVTAYVITSTIPTAF